MQRSVISVSLSAAGGQEVTVTVTSPQPLPSGSYELLGRLNDSAQALRDYLERGSYEIVRHDHPLHEMCHPGCPGCRNAPVTGRHPHHPDEACSTGCTGE